MEGADIFGGRLENFDKFRLNGGKGLVNFLGTDGEGGQLCAVKLTTEAEERGIALGTDRRNDVGNRCFDVDRRGGSRKDLGVRHFAVFENLYHEKSFPKAVFISPRQAGRTYS